MAARLQHRQHDIALPTGTFLIGRGVDCQLALDDPMVSRRHAALHLDRSGSAVIEDLGARNGVFVNGERVQGREPLAHGDVIRIGSQDICYYEVAEDRPAHAAASRASRETIARISATDLAAALAHPQVSTPPAGAARDEAQTGAMPAVRRDREGFPLPDEDSVTKIGALGSGARPGAGLLVIGAVAEKALALGRAEEAERLLQRSLADVAARAGKGELDAELAERAASYAVRLAAATGHGTWIDYVFTLYTCLRALLPARLVDELYAAVRKVKATDKSVLHAYTACLKETSGSFGPAERFVQQRIEGIERWAP